MIYFITGVPGSGKSLLAVQRIIEWKREGRMVFANIDGLDLTAVGEPPHDGTAERDWREYPDGSVIVYDEAQRTFPATGKAGRVDDPVLTDAEESRHRGIDLVFLTQNSTFVHHHFRKLCTDHTHVLRAFGLPRATLFRWPEAVDATDRRERQRADASSWWYPKKLYRAYKSATIHTHKARLPRKLVILGGVLGALVAMFVWRFVSTGSLFVLDSENAVPQEAGAGLDGGGSGSEPVEVDQGRARVRGTDHLGGDPTGLASDGPSPHWRITGRVRVLDGKPDQWILQGRDGAISIPAPDRGWRVRDYRDGVLYVDAPGGDIAVTWHTGPKPRQPAEQLEPVQEAGGRGGGRTVASRERNDGERADDS